MLDSGHYGSIADLARAEKIGRSYISTMLGLGLLAPDIVEAILDGRQSERVTLEAMMERCRWCGESRRSCDRGGREPHVAIWVLRYGDLPLTTRVRALEPKYRELGGRGISANRPGRSGRRVANFQLDFSPPGNPTDDATEGDFESRVEYVDLFGVRGAQVRERNVDVVSRKCVGLALGRASRARPPRDCGEHRLDVHFDALFASRPINGREQFHSVRDWNPSIIAVTWSSAAR